MPDFLGLWEKLKQMKPSTPQTNRLQALFLVVLLGLPLFIVAYAYGPCEVRVNGKVIGVARNPQVVNAAMAKVKAEKSAVCAYPVELIDEVSLKKRIWLTPKLAADKGEMQTRFSTLNYAAQGLALQVKGETRLVVADAITADTVLNALKAHYINTLTLEENLKSIAFKEEITWVPVWTAPEEICDVEAAVEHILAGDETEAAIATYTVKKGDSLWRIAQEHDLHVDDLMEANLELSSDALALDQVLRLHRPQPLLTVLITSEKATEEAIPFPVDTQAVKDKPRSYKQVVQAGVPGTREVTYHLVRENDRVIAQEILQAHVIQEPIKQVEKQGTLVTVAARGLNEGGTSLTWPLSGRINSPFGPRGKSFHQGIDIKGKTGDPIRAAGSGKVIQAGWSGAYGNLIVLQHSNGIRTYYGHCSSLNVKSGQQVTQGTIIGRVGTTGRSIGPHLHFEVSVNGKKVNPVPYLR